MSNTIESLELEIVSNSKSAVDGIDALTQSLEKLKSATKGGLGLSSVAKETGKLNTAMGKLTLGNNKSSSSFSDFYQKLQFGERIIKKVTQSLWKSIKKSNDYVENLNLFTVSMGEYADEALGYAETVSDAMGIDTSEWIRNQGIFMTMATGFGVASDRAATMSKNLTQLGYDLSSFYNMDTEKAMLKLKSGLAGELEPLRAIGYDLSQAKLEATATELGITKAVSAMTQAEKAQLRYYAIMTQVTVAQGDMARTLEDPANQLRVFKAQVSMASREIGNVFIPALNAILPYAIAVVKVIRNLASEISILFGYEPPEIDAVTSEVAENTNVMAENLEDSQKEAKKLKSYLMGIDELNVINPNNSDALGGAGEFDFELPEYDFMGGLVESKIEGIVTAIQEALDEIGMIVTGATLGLGAVLAFTGVNIPLGVSLMALGAYSLVTQLAVNWNSMENPMTTTLGIIEGIIGGGLLALGGILAFSGVNVPLGIALMSMGAVTLVTAVALNWNSLTDSTREVLGAITGIVGASLLAIGGIMAFSGANIPLGIALMGAGAISLVSSATLNWEALTSDVGSCISSIGTIISGAFLVVGALLAFSGASVPLGLALMLTGALSMGTAIALNTNLLSDEVKSVMATITSAVSIGLLAVGAILAFTGANIPLGIALMAGGALALGTAIAPNWNSLSNSVKSTITNIMSIVGAGLLGVGAILAFSGVNIPLGIGLMLAGAISLGTAIALNWNSIVDALQGPVGGITALVSGALIALGAILLFTGVGIPLGLGLMLAGAAGLGTVVAVNWNYLTDKVSEVWNGIVEICSSIATWFNENVITPVVDFFEGLWRDISDFFTNLWNDIVAIWTTVATWFNDNVITPIVDFFRGIWTSVSGFFTELWNDIVAIWTTVSNWFDENIITPISDFFEGLTMRIGQFFEGCWLIIQAVWVVVSTWFDENVIQPIVNFFSPIVESIANFFSQLWDDIVTLWTEAPTWFNDTIVTPIVEFFKGVWTSVSGFFSDLWEDIKDVWDKVSTWFNDNVVTPVANFFEGLWTSVSGFFSSLWDDIKAVWDKVSGWFDDNIISPVKTAFETACEAIGGFFSSLWEGIKKGIAAAMNAVIGAIESTINWVIGGINNLIGGFNKVVQWAADVLGQDWSGITLVQTVSLKRIAFAEGGFPEQGQMFIAREAGAEMVGNIGRRTAVANNDQIVSGIAGGVAQANEEQNALLREQNSLLRALLEKDSGVYLDGKNLTNSVEKYQRERGRVLIAGGVV